jgi:hypothetical protein
LNFPSRLRRDFIPAVAVDVIDFVSPFDTFSDILKLLQQLQVGVGCNAAFRVEQQSLIDPEPAEWGKVFGAETAKRFEPSPVCQSTGSTRCIIARKF